MTKPEGPPGGPARTLIGRPIQLPPREGEKPAEPPGPAPLPGVSPLPEPANSLESTIPQGSGALHEALHAALNAGPEKMAAELARVRGQSIQQALANAPIPDPDAVAKLAASQPTARGPAPPEVQAVVAAQDASARGHFAGTAQQASPSQFQQPGQAGAFPAAPEVPQHDATMYANPNQAAAPMAEQRVRIPTGQQQPQLQAAGPIAEQRVRPPTAQQQPQPSVWAMGNESLRVVPNDHYQIVEEFARGGMGRIVRANDTRLNRTVAIKELLGSHAALKARFEREALITARLQHPAIVPIYEAGRWPTGELFFAMKLVSGRPLDVLIGSRATLAERLGLLPNVIALAEALAYAHSHNIVHRDLKPQNVLIGDFGETVVIDWGLAKDLSTTEQAEPAGPFRNAVIPGATVAGSIMGTPAYMPPEQGKGQQVDARADVYAIGALLYHVLTKHPPYEGPDAMTMLKAMLAAPPRPPQELEPDVPPELATICAKAMAREADQRYATARELVEDLKRYQTGNLVRTHRYSFRELFARWAKKHKAALAVGVTAFAILVVVGVIAISRVVAAKNQALEQQELAVVAQKKAEESEAHAKAAETRAKQSETRVTVERDRQRFMRARRIELDHFKHTQLTSCAGCHKIDPVTFTAKDGSPGHAECSACHEASLMDSAKGEAKCGFCHLERPAPGKDLSTLHACDAESVLALKSTTGKSRPCFRHDLKAHRIAADGQPLACTNCHGVLADKSLWKSRSYTSLRDLDVNPVIGGRGADSMHTACGTGCHHHEKHMSVTAPDGERNCPLCHSDSTKTF
jgi:hypothetical protein